jgi:alpha-mannosidase
MSSPSSFDVHVVSHTHWDREWYLPLARFRQRLTALVDDLLDSPLKNATFLLDGQAILLDDYLAVRPEREPELRAALEREALEAGPWLVLADELLPSGEALVRNLLAGTRLVRARGGKPMDVLYCPDSFGHPADLPALAEGFGFRLIILWRGLGGTEWPEGDAFQWRAAGGARSLVHHLPPWGYEYGANLPSDDAGARERWTALRRVLASRARTGALLVLNGADHHARQSHLERAVDALTRAAKPDRVHRSSLRRFAAEFVASASSRNLPEIEGELRFSPGYTWTVPGTWSSRAYQKRRNARVERLLTREAEPWAAIAAARGGADRGSLLRAAWRTLLECHPHDTLCGCSSDAVAAAADARFSFAQAEGRGIVDDAIHDLAGHDAESARGMAWTPHVLVRNPAPRSRSGVTEIELTRFVADEPVGPGSGRVPVAERHLSAPVALENGRVALQVLAHGIRSDRLESPRHYPDNDRVDVTRCVAWVADVPGYGIVPLAIGDGDGQAKQLPHPPALGRGRSLDNGVLRVDIDDRGAIRLEAKQHGLVWDSVIGFDDVGDAGDLYTHSAIGRPVRVRTVPRITLVHDGPFRAELLARLALELPASSDREGRSAATARNDIELTLTLDMGSPMVRVAVRGRNRSRDHRLRLVVATGAQDGATTADAMFSPVVRVPRPQPPRTREMEVIPATAPLGRWVTHRNAARGLTLISDGLGEYEVLEDGAIAVTLLRAVGALSRRDIPERPGHAGWPTPTPGAQCLGRFGARFAILPHGSEADVIGEVERAADDALLPLRGTTLRSATRSLMPVAGLTLSGEGLRFLACKPGEDEGWTVLRCVNTTAREVSGRWSPSWPVQEARGSRLDERAGPQLPVRDGNVAIVVPPHAVSTILVR